MNVSVPVLLTQGGAALLFWWYMMKYGWGVYLLFYAPIGLLRVACWTFLGAAARRSVRRPEFTGSPVDMLSSRLFPTVAPYLQTCVWGVVYVLVLAVRPWYFYNEVAGGRTTSPCGQSSCSRTGASPEQVGVVFNPRGYFPVTSEPDMQQFNRFGTTEYTFCAWHDNCRWAPATNETNHGITFFSDVKCTTKVVTADIDINAHYVSRRTADYDNLGWGIKDYRGATCDRPIDGIDACPGAGTKICATCDLYENAFKALIGVSNDFRPSFADADEQCAPKADGSVNPLCFICPNSDEEVTENALSTLLYLHVVLMGEPVLAILLVVRAVLALDDELNYETVDEEEEEEEEASTLLTPQGAAAVAPPTRIPCQKMILVHH